MRISNLVNDNGNPTKNQFLLESENGKFFQSYDTICARLHNGEVSLNVDYFGEHFTNSSNTTRKYLYVFLRDYARLDVHKKKDIINYLKNGYIKMVNETELTV